MLTSIAWGEREVEVRIMRGVIGYSGGQSCLRRQKENYLEYRWELVLHRRGGASIVNGDRSNHAD